MLEVGVGSGWNLAELDCQKKLGHDLLEHLRDQLERRDIEFVKDTADLEDGEIDVCICHHMLEHVPSPPQILAEIHRLLASGGTMLLFVPYEREKRGRDGKHYAMELQVVDACLAAYARATPLNLEFCLHLGYCG